MDILKNVRKKVAKINELINIFNNTLLDFITICNTYYGMIYSTNLILFKRNIFGQLLTFRPSAVLPKPANFI